MRREVNRPRVAHRLPGRIRLRLPNELDQRQTMSLLQDLKCSPEIRHASLRGRSLVIEHAENTAALTEIGNYLSKVFPEFERWSDELDSEIAKAVADPWINKTIPFGLFGLALFRGLRDGAVLAGESAFALAYIAFDLYWKFQQENIIRKIESGLSQKDRDTLESDSPDRDSKSANRPQAISNSANPRKTKTNSANQSRPSSKLANRSRPASKLTNQRRANSKPANLVGRKRRSANKRAS